MVKLTLAGVVYKCPKFKVFGFNFVPRNLGSRRHMRPRLAAQGTSTRSATRDLDSWRKLCILPYPTVLNVEFQQYFTRQRGPCLESGHLIAALPLPICALGTSARGEGDLDSQRQGTSVLVSRPWPFSQK